MKVSEYIANFLFVNKVEYIFELSGGMITHLLDAIHLENKIKISTENNTTSAANDLPEIVLIDTNMYVLKVWCEFVFEKCHPWILNQIVENSYDLYLLCDIDLPWVKDELREYPEVGIREKLYHHYKDLLINQSTPWVNISGNYQQRVEKAVNAIDSIRTKTSLAS